MKTFKLISLGFAFLSLTGCSLWYGEKFDPVEESVVSPMGEPAFASVDGLKLDPVLLEPDPEPYRLGPGDKVKIEIAEMLGTAQICLVMPDGRIYFDLAGGVDAAGSTLTELSEELSFRLADYYTSPVVTVNLEEVHNARFQVLGAVNLPGVYPIDKKMRLLDAISTAGGLMNSNVGSVTPEMAALNRAMIIRDGKSLPVDFESLVKQGDMTQNIYVKSGDYIFLPSAQHQKVYVLGWVNGPRAISYSDPITVLQAVARAEGPRPGGYVSRALVIRGSTSNPRVAVVNLSSIAKGVDSDFTLESGDIVWVPKSPWSTLGEYVYEALDSAASAVAVSEGVALFPDSDVSISVSSGSNGSVGTPLD